MRQQDKYDICASFQKTAVGHIMQKLKKQCKQKVPKNFAIVGGARADIYLRAQVDEICKK
ncbi:tRNA (adenosine(37)-N6)-threonylcarbamoyltransferase complex transferase subunit TsaD, partial [Aliarcobacter butzleri]